jgi:14-3-3 protein epsilon
MAEIEDKLYLARVCHLSGLHEETLKYIEEVINLKNGNINEEEKNLFLNSLKYLINFRRESWRTINVLESKEIKNQANLLPRVTELKKSLEEEIRQLVYKGIEIIDNKLLKENISDELKVIYCKIKGDYIRYVIEFTPKDKEEERNILIENADKSYKIGLNFCESLNDLNTAKVGLILNYSVFLYEIMGDYKNAYILANNTYQKTMKIMNEENHDLFNNKEINKMLKLLKENIGIWAETVVQENVENIASDI